MCAHWDRSPFLGIGIPIKIKRSCDRRIFIMEIPILVRQHLYTETAPWWQKSKLEILASGRNKKLSLELGFSLVR